MRDAGVDEKYSNIANNPNRGIFHFSVENLI